MKACFMGLGYIGLPTAIIAAKHGVEVVGVDVNPSVVDITNSGKLHIVEDGLEELLQEVIASGNFKAYTKIAKAIICLITLAYISHSSLNMKVITINGKICLYPEKTLKIKNSWTNAYVNRQNELPNPKVVANLIIATKPGSFSTSKPFNVPCSRI